MVPAWVVAWRKPRSLKEADLLEAVASGEWKALLLIFGFPEESHKSSDRVSGHLQLYSGPQDVVLTTMRHNVMRAYSEDLRTRIVAAVEDGLSKSEAARLFNVSLSSVKRYLRISERGGSLEPRKGGGRPPKANAALARMLEEDVNSRPYDAVWERAAFLRSVSGVDQTRPIIAQRRAAARAGSKGEILGCVHARQI